MQPDVEERWLETVRRWRLHPDGPADDTLWAPELEACSREQLRAIQEEKLRILVPFLWERAPFYRRKLEAAGLGPGDVRTLEDLRRVPPTTKRELSASAHAHPPWGAFDALSEVAWSKRGWMIFSTSGTTGAPQTFRFSLHDRDQWAWNYARAMWAGGIRPGEGPMFVALPYTPHVFGWGAHYACNLLGIPVIPAGAMDTARRIHLIGALRPAAMCSTPSYCLYLAQAMLDQGIDPAASSVRRLFIAGEPGGTVAATKHRLEALWGARVTEAYGATEGSPSPGGYQCTVTSTAEPYSDHLNEDSQIWEVVDPKTFEGVRDGELGVAIVTNLYSHSTPLLRFVLGDYTRLSTAPCACGRTHAQAVGGFVGRADDMLTIRGLNVFPSAIEDVVRGFAELTTEYELVVRREPDALEVRAEVRPEVPNGRHAALAGAIADRVRLATEVRPQVTLVAPGTIERPMFKARRTREEDA